MIDIMSPAAAGDSAVGSRGGLTGWAGLSIRAPYL